MLPLKTTHARWNLQPRACRLQSAVCRRQGLTQRADFVLSAIPPLCRLPTAPPPKKKKRKLIRHFLQWFHLLQGLHPSEDTEHVESRRFTTLSVSRYREDSGTSLNDQTTRDPRKYCGHTLISSLCLQNDSFPGSGLDHPFPEGAFKSLLLQKYKYSLCWDWSCALHR